MLKTYWWKTPRGLITNFGDQLNPYLIEKITKNKPQHSVPSPEYDTLLCIGSILGLFMDRLQHCVVWGSGFGRKPSQLKCLLKGTKLNHPKRICAVRGPLTKDAFSKFNIECPEIYGDPALLMPRFFNPDVKTEHEIGIIPHYTDAGHPWIQECRKKGFFIIDVNKPVETVICDLLSCKKLISTSLHGLIVADAYQIPAVWIILSKFMKKQSFKFYDYFSSLGYTNEKPVMITNAGYPVEKVLKYHRDRKVKLDLDRLLSVCPLAK